MAKQDPAKLAAALRANLRKRKGAVPPQPSYGFDEEGDVVPSEGADADAAAWVREGSKKL